MGEDNTQGQVSAEMPKYKCHKTVHALKVKQVVTNEDGSWAIIPEDERFSKFNITNEYYEKHSPQIGGYYIVYEDGYKSFSPADVFEKGYVLV